MDGTRYVRSADISTADGFSREAGGAADSYTSFNSLDRGIARRNRRIDAIAGHVDIRFHGDGPGSNADGRGVYDMIRRACGLPRDYVLSPSDEITRETWRLNQFAEESPPIEVGQAVQVPIRLCP